MSTHFLNNDRPLKPAPIYTAKKLTADQLKQRLLQLPNVKSFLQPSFTDEDLLQQAGYALGHTYHEKHILITKHRPMSFHRSVFFLNLNLHITHPN